MCADDLDRLSAPLRLSTQSSSSPGPPRHVIEPLFGFVDFTKIKANPDASWFTRDRKRHGNRAKEDFSAIESMATNIKEEGILEPLHVLFEGDVSDDLLHDRIKLASCVQDFPAFTLALGFRRYLAIETAIEHGYLEKDSLKVPVRIYLRKELESKLSENVEHFLTKAAISSNVFFKGYSSDDKLRLTRTLIEQLRAQKGQARHRDILHLLGIRSSESAADHRASLRRFAVCNNDVIFAALTGVSSDLKHDPLNQILTFQVAEHLANRLGRSTYLVEEFLSKLRDDIALLRLRPVNRLRKSDPGSSLIGYDSSKYCRWIENLLVFGETRADQLAAPGYSFGIKCRGHIISIPAVAIDLKDDSRESFARVVDVYFHLNSLCQSLRNFLYDVRPFEEGGERRPGRDTIPWSNYRANEYKDFIRKLHLERYANVNALKRVFSLGDKLCEWALPSDLGSLEEAQTAESPAVSRESAREQDVGETLVNQWVVNKVAEDNRCINHAEAVQAKELDKNHERIADLVKYLPLMAGTFAAYSKSLTAFSALREVFGEVEDAIATVAKHAGMEGAALNSTERKLRDAIDLLERFTPDRVAAERIAGVFEGLLPSESTPSEHPTDSNLPMGSADIPLPSTGVDPSLEPTDLAPTGVVAEVGHSTVAHEFDGSCTAPSPSCADLAGGSTTLVEGSDEASDGLEFLDDAAAEPEDCDAEVDDLQIGPQQDS